MFVVILKFSKNKALAGQFMEAHKQWIQRGLDDGIFLLVGSLRPEGGGAVLAHQVSRSELEDRVSQDPFVAEDIVTADLLEIEPARVDNRWQFLLDG